MSVLDVPAIDYDEIQMLAEVHRMTSKVIELAGGSVPPVGSPQWWSAEPITRIAGLLVLAEARLIDDPHQLAAEQIKAVSVAISGGMDWRTFVSNHVAHTELQRRRDQLGPLYEPYTGGPVQWDATSSQDDAT